MEKERELLELANVVYYCGGDPSSLLAKIEKKARQAEIEESFCLLSRNRVMAIIASLDEMLELFRGLLQSSQDPRIEKFVRCKEDIHAILARGVVNQTLRDGELNRRSSCQG